MSWGDWGWDMVTSSIAGVGEVISEVNETFVKPTLDEMSDQAAKIRVYLFPSACSNV
jgi:hypothetical protein